MASSTPKSTSQKAGVKPPARGSVKRRSVSTEHLPKVLRIGVIQGGKIIEERIIRRRETITIGPSEKNTFVIPAQDLPSSRFDIFETRGDHYTLNFSAAMNGRISTDGQVVELADLRSSGRARKKGKLFQITLNDKARGKVLIGDSTILFQFVAPPPIQPRPQLPSSVRGSMLAGMGSFVVIAWQFFF